MYHSLINPNHSILFGMSIWDNLYYDERPIGMDTGDLFIPFHTEWSTVYFDICYSSVFELETFLHIVMTDEM